MMEQNVADGQKIENEQPEHPVEGQSELVGKPEAKVEAKLIENPEAKPQVEAEQEAGDTVGVIDAFAESTDDKKPEKVEPEVTAEAPTPSSAPEAKPEVEQKPEQQEEREVGRFDDFGMTDDQKSSLVRHVKGEFSQRDQLAGKLAEIEQKQQQEKKQEVTVDDRLEFLKEVNGRFELRDDISERLANATGKDRDTLERSLYLLDRQIKGDCKVLIERGFEKQLADDPEMRQKVEGSYQSDLSGHPGWRQSDLHVEVRKSSVPLTYYTQPAFSDPYVQKILARENEFRAEQQFLDGGPSELPAEYRQRMSAVEPQAMKTEKVVEVEGQKVVENPEQKVEKVAEVEGQKVVENPEQKVEGQQQDGQAEQKVDGQAVEKFGPDARVKPDQAARAEVGQKDGQKVEVKAGAEVGPKVEQQDAGEGRKVDPSARVAVNSGEKVGAKAAKEAPIPRVAVDPGQQQKPAEKLEIHRYSEAIELGRELHKARTDGHGQTDRSKAISSALVEADQRWSQQDANGFDARQYNSGQGRGLRGFVTILKTEESQRQKAAGQQTGHQASPAASQARPPAQPRPAMTAKAMEQHRQQHQRQQEMSIER